MSKMRALYLLALLPFLSCAASEGYEAFINPMGDTRSQSLLVDRETCQPNYDSCANFGFANACCPAGTNCAFDNAFHLACCPVNAVCTGSIGGPWLGTGTSTSSTPVTTSLPITSFTSVVGAGSTITNALYPFYYIPSSFANAADCSAAYTFCQSESSACLVSLAGQQGVTISGPDITGLTVPGYTGTAITAAASTCSGYYATACHNIQLSVCVPGNAAGPGPTAGPGAIYAACAGAVFGALGALA